MSIQSRPQPELNIVIDDMDICFIFWISDNKCHVCGLENVTVLNADNSGDEYGHYSICKDCVQAAFKAFSAKRKTKNV